jgi:4-aminobutyrate aminotransferase/(S)-3-amino-2-methylpropionate transaminase
MEDIDINALGQKVGHIVRRRFEAMKQRFPGTVVAVHGLGAMLSIELRRPDGQPAAELTKQILHYANQQGLILINAGVLGNYIRVLSPLVISEAHLERGLDIIENALEKLAPCA